MSTDVRFETSVFQAFNTFLLLTYPQKTIFTAQEAVIAVSYFSGLPPALVAHSFIPNSGCFSLLSLREYALNAALYQTTINAQVFGEEAPLPYGAPMTLAARRQQMEQMYGTAFQAVVPQAHSWIPTTAPSHVPGRPTVNEAWHEGQLSREAGAPRSPSPVHPHNVSSHNTTANTTDDRSHRCWGPAEASRKICKQYHLTGKCTFGSRCLYHHVDCSSLGTTASVSAPTTTASSASTAKEREEGGHLDGLSPLPEEKPLNATHSPAADLTTDENAKPSIEDADLEESKPLGIMDRCTDNDLKKEEAPKVPAHPTISKPRKGLAKRAPSNGARSCRSTSHRKSAKATAKQSTS